MKKNKIIFFALMMPINLISMSHKRKREESVSDDLNKKQETYWLTKEFKKSVYNRDFNKIKKLIEQGADVNCLFKFRNKILNLLTVPAYRAHLDIIEYLVSIDGIDLNHQNNANNTPLLNVCRIQPNLKIIELLIAKKANINLQNGAKFSPLIEVCDCQFYDLSLDAAKLLVKHGANINLQTYQGRTALIYAAKSGNIELATFLLNSGADVTVKDYSDWDFIDWAKNKNVKDALRKAVKELNDKKFKLAYTYTPLPKELLAIVISYL